MRLRGTPTYGGGSYYKLIGSVHEGKSAAEPGDARIEHGGNAQRDALLRGADRTQAILARTGTRITFVQIANPETTTEVEIPYGEPTENQASGDGQ